MYSVHLVHFCPIQFSLVLFGSTQSISVHSVHFGLIRSPLVRARSVQFGTFCVLLSNLVLFGLSQPNSVYSIHFGLIRSIQYWSVHFNPIQSTLVHFRPILSTLVHSVLFGPIRSILVQHSICSVQENFQKP